MCYDVDQQKINIMILVEDYCLTIGRKSRIPSPWKDHGRIFIEFNSITHKSETLPFPRTSASKSTVLPSGDQLGLVTRESGGNG